MSRRKLTRREAVATGVASAAALTALGASAKESVMSSKKMMPVAYVPHAGGPFSFVEFGMDPKEVRAVVDYWRTLAASAPKALLVISAHWETDTFTVMTAEKPPMLYDYYGFPPAAYSIEWPAPGEPKLARRVRELLDGAGLETAEDNNRGFDHGTFVPLKRAFPKANVPTVQLSLKKGLDPAAHLAAGRALRPLRDDGVLIVGSGMSFHNMRLLRGAGGADVAETFDTWLREAAVQTPVERDAALTAWATAPEARGAHPREEHLMPLMVVAGAAGDDRGHIPFNGPIMGKTVSAIHFG